MENVLIGARKRVQPKDIVLLRADINYTVVYYKNGQSTLVATTLKSLESRFKSFGFYRTHKSYLVNLEFISAYNEQNKQVEMLTQLKATVSRRKKEGLLEYMRQMAC
jgi:DNA-binding LytR/AlgR family response regulator